MKPVARLFGTVCAGLGLLALAGCQGTDTVTAPVPTATPTPVVTATPTATATPLKGPVITFLGLARADDTLIEPIGTTPSGAPIFTRTIGASFWIVVEGKPGADGSPVGESAYQPNLDGFPDLQIWTSNVLGNGSEAVCDDTPPTLGGVPATNPVNFEATQANIDHVNDLACRFRNGSNVPVGRGPDEACVKAPVTEDYVFVDSQSTIEFCGFMNFGALLFPPGDTVITVRLRDILGNVGATEQLVVRVGS